MAIVVIGGQARKVGKTSVVCGLIAALRDREWTAVKVSQHAHDLEAGETGREWTISEERDQSGGSDTSRFLLAGAARALWLRTNPGQLGGAIPALQSELRSAGNVIMESNSVVRFIRPDVYLVVLDPANPDVKESVREFFESADAVIIHDARNSETPPFETGEGWGSNRESISQKLVFRIRPPNYVTPEMIEFVRRHVNWTT